MKDLQFSRVCACTLNRIFGYEPGIISAIIRSGIGLEDIFSIPERERDKLWAGRDKYKGSLSGAELEKSAKELESLRKTGYSFLSIEEPLYPEKLRDCPDAPLGLYVKTQTPLEDLFEGPSVAIVGTRDLSSYGLEWSRRIAASLSGLENAPLIVSGLALGVDIAAHRETLDKGGRTIAVLPCGITDVYPRSHYRDALRIASSPGSALVTDFPPGTEPTRITFLRRNRIIAGLSDATLIVESRIKGGGMITAGLADDYGREVYALPGRVDDLRSAGCNYLIRIKKAEMISGLTDLNVSLGLWSGDGAKKKTAEILTRKRFEKVEKDLRRKVCPEDADLMMGMIREISKEREIDLEELCQRLAQSYAKVSRAASALEAERIINIDLLSRCSIVPEIK